MRQAETRRPGTETEGRRAAERRRRWRRSWGDRTVTGYVASLASVTEHDGTLYVLCFSNDGPETGPHPIDNPPLEPLSEPPPAEGDAGRWTSERLRSALEDCRVDHERVRLDPEARNVRHTHVDPSDDRRTWRVQQVLVDPEGHNDWMAEWEVDLAASRAANHPVLWLRGIGPIG